MAIYALIRHKSLKIDVSYRNMDASSTLVNWRNLYMFDVHVNPESTIQLYKDSYAVIDSAVFVLDKGLSDSLGFSSQAVFTVGKQLTDTTSLSDSSSLHANKAVTDITTLSESSTLDINLNKLSEVITTDQLTVTRQPNNWVFLIDENAVTVTGEFDDEFTVSDQIDSFAVSKSLQDFFTLDDFAQINKDVEGVKSNVFGFTESLEASFGKVIDNESLSLTDQASLSFSKPATDSIGLSEALGLHSSRLSTDQTALSDAAALSLGKVKADSAPITDTLESNVGKSIQNQLFSLTDQSLFALSKPLTDSIMVQDLLTYHASKSATDTTALNDAATLSPRIGKSDSTLIVDSLDIEHVVASALFNQAMIGNAILNAD